MADDPVAARLSNLGGLSRTLGERVLDYGDGRARVELAISEKVMNPVGALHGGALAALVDSAGTIAIMASPKNPLAKPGVTTDLAVTYLAPAREGVVVAAAEARKVGRTLEVADVQVTREDGTVVALGRMTKFMAG